MFLAIALTALAQAAPTGHYHPDAIAQSSLQFARAQDVAGTVFQERQETAHALAAALNRFEENLDLLGDAAPAAQRERYDTLHAAFQLAIPVLRQHAQAQLDGLDAAFQAAVVRAQAGEELEICATKAKRGLRLHPKRGSEGDKTCPGPDRNADLTAAIDADAKLIADLDALLAQEWPQLALPIEAVSAIPSTDAPPTHAIPIGPLFRDHLVAELTSIRTTDEDERLAIQARAEDDPSDAELRRLLALADQITAKTAATRAELASPVLAALNKRATVTAKKRDVDLGWCAQPELLGGCTQPGASEEIRTSVLSHPSVDRAWDKAIRSMR